MTDTNKKTQYVSITELADMLGISRVAVFKRIQKGQIPAEKIGNSYAIPMEFVTNGMNGSAPKILTENEKEEIEKAVDKVVNEYGEALRLLGKE
ncbi:hypothetical protein A2886_01600 [candidate division WWE3 bacterium RIFCSPHIGHO2_01_FULL_42_13]|uniref:Helix-turn-helix domain-containing protein n=1 Tax=candidate division WWE3 bacterium RIFCSPHIGHO2_01_FULL_42_13 TaxID=1802617 RepID=A0A1F4USP5_UNCKA|nr:MAG: hypothetical protein A2886_01600 [candidate division WWE3 bacterium RIFCSPHIGHO2_01_FULL_42_13]